MNGEIACPAVSVVIPCLNAALTIEAAVASASVQQQQLDVQIICIDDNSKDNTPMILSKLADEGIIEYLAYQPGGVGGAAVARNRGLHHARGAFIQFLDADDTLVERKLHRQVKLMCQDEADLVAGSYRHHSLQGITSDNHPHEDLWCGLLGSRLGRTSGNLYRKQSLIDINGWDEQQKSSQEYELMFRLLKNNAKVVYDREIGTNIYATQGSISQRNLHDNALRFIELRTKMADYLSSIEQLTVEREALYHSICERSEADLRVGA